MFTFDGGKAVAYDHLPTNYGHQIHGCPHPEICRQVEQRMVDWFNTLPGQVKVRRAKVDRMQFGTEVNLKRLENE